MQCKPVTALSVAGAAALVAPRGYPQRQGSRFRRRVRPVPDGQLNYPGWSGSWAYLVGHTPITHEWWLMTVLPRVPWYPADYDRSTPGRLAKSLVLVRARF